MTGHEQENLDRFGRVLKKAWENPTEYLDQFAYTYDESGNRLTRSVAATPQFNQAYQYDGGNRLTSYTAGGTPEQAWDLDALGNWSTFSYRDEAAQVTQTRTHNAANELQTISNWSSPTQTDAAGNMTSVPNPKSPRVAMSLKYDAWNRLVQADANIYRYDGLNRRIAKELAGGSREHFYYNQAWQCLESRQNDSLTPHESNVWHPYYIDALAKRFWDSTGDGQTTGQNETHYALQDANFNVTSLVDSIGKVRERYEYSAYGTLTVREGDWTPRRACNEDCVTANY